MSRGRLSNKHLRQLVVGLLADKTVFVAKRDAVSGIVVPAIVDQKFDLRLDRDGFIELHHVLDKRSQIQDLYS
jgi:hypothetical protein